MAKRARIAAALGVLFLAIVAGGAWSGYESREGLFFFVLSGGDPSSEQYGSDEMYASGGIGVYVDPHEWKAVTPIQLRNISGGKLVVEAIDVETDGILVDEIFLIPPRNITPYNKWNARWPGELNFDEKGTIPVDTDLYRDVSGFKFGTSSDLVDPNMELPFFSNELRDATVLMKVRLADDVIRGSITSATIRYRYERGNTWVVGEATVPRPLFMCEPHLLEKIPKGSCD